MRLSVETDRQEQVYICVDREGLAFLHKALERLQRIDQVSLFTAKYGGSDLTEEWPSDNRYAAHHLKICLGSPDDLFIALKRRDPKAETQPSKRKTSAKSPVKMPSSSRKRKITS